MPGKITRGKPFGCISTTRNSAPLPSRPKPAPSCEIGVAPVSCSATPRAISIMPSVATKGGIRSRVMTRPLNAPQAAPARTPAHIAGTTGRPALTAIADTTPDSASTEPTDRSIPPVMMTMVSPIPSSPMTDVCNSTVSPLLTDRNAGLAIAKPMISRTSVSRADARCSWSRAIVSRRALPSAQGLLASVIVPPRPISS